MPKTRKALTRCPWSLAGGERYIAYHDEEWGVPVWDDGKQFEFLVLESAQAGLSWSTVLNKRDGYRNAFADFDPEKVARFTARRIEHWWLIPASYGTGRRSRRRSITLGSS